MADFLFQVLQETWFILKEAAVFLLVGFTLAGVLAALVPSRILLRLFGTGKVKSVLWASAIGTPLPLCSCGVLPAALGLRRQGATKGATVSFLISTPETGIDSISLSYALMDPIITVFRPVTAMITATTAGLATNFFGERRPREQPRPEDCRPDGAVAAHSHLEHDHGHDHAHAHDHLHGAPEDETGGREGPLLSRRSVQRVYRYAFRDLLDEISHWLVLGIVLSGIVAAVVPPTLVERYLSNEVASMLLMLFIGLPLYTCASASTPIAAALVMKGLNPGAALVFLLAGPATSLGSIIVLLRFLGARVVAIYLASIAAITLFAGFTLNWVYRAWEISPQATFGAGTGFVPEPVKVAGAVMLAALLLLSIRRTRVPGEWLWLRDKIGELTGIALTATRLKIAAVAAVCLLYLSTGLIAVQPGEIGVRARFGQIVAPELAPGLHYRLPWPFESHRIVPKDLVQRVEFGFRSGQPQRLTERAQARQRLTVGGPSNPVPEAIKATGFWFQKETLADESFLLTGDGNLIDIRSIVQYRVKDPVAYAYNIVDPEALIRSATLAALAAVAATSAIDVIYTTARSDIENRVARTEQALLDKHRAGIEVLSVHLLYVHPPEEVHDAFRDVASAQEDKLRTINRAQIFAVEKVNQSKGEAAATIEQALAFRSERILHAQGEAAGFARRVDEYRRAPELTRFRLQLEAIEDVLPGVRKIVRPGAADLKDFDLWLLEPFGTSRDK